MKVFLGIDLGSTTSKAILVDAGGNIIGRGITNTRSDYAVAADIARMEAEFNSRFALLRRKLQEDAASDSCWDQIIPSLENRFHWLQFQARFDRLMEAMLQSAALIEDAKLRSQVEQCLAELSPRMRESSRRRFFNGEISATSRFFRDLFSCAYVAEISAAPKDLYDTLLAAFDRSINPAENSRIDFDFGDLVREALDLLPEEMPKQRGRFERHLAEISNLSLQPADYFGTGYGRQLLPFEKQHIRSEILCHAFGAHACFPQTRTVLDIGGQDTKAIQVDPQGLVTSFQMNDRCAAGCGRYLGYIADEMNISVGELGPLALRADFETNICSTCTVFAGAELREYLNLGEKKENILAGLHKAIVQRAFALLARSGGVRNEFTFTGGVARNPAVVRYVGQMVTQNYGNLTINHHPDSIFMGALGAALFSVHRG